MKPMSKIKKILLGILAIVVLFVVVQIVNAAKYAMTVRVVEGENVIGVNPLAERLDFGDLSRNNRIARQVSIQNGGGIDIFVAAFKFGELSELVDIDKNFFVVPAKTEAKLVFEVGIPPSAETREYSGGVWIFRLPKPF